MKRLILLVFAAFVSLSSYGQRLDICKFILNWPHWLTTNQLDDQYAELSYIPIGEAIFPAPIHLHEEIFGGIALEGFRFGDYDVFICPDTTSFDARFSAFAAFISPMEEGAYENEKMFATLSATLQKALGDPIHKEKYSVEYWGGSTLHTTAIWQCGDYIVYPIYVTLTGQKRPVLYGFIVEYV